MITSQKALSIIEKAKDSTVLACGDVMLDAYMTGNVERFSQEAPVPVVAVQEEHFFPGGAGNSAACMSTIGLNPHLISVVGGNDRIKYHQILEEECTRLGIKPLFILDEKRKTTLKLRLAAIKTTKQHIARVDIEDTRPLDASLEKAVIEKIDQFITENEPGAITIHDYKKGLLTEKIFGHLMNISKSHALPVFADLKQDTFIQYRSLISAPELFILKPNRVESVETAKKLNGFDKDGTSDEQIIQIAQIIQAEAPINIIITRGAKGAVLFEYGKDPYFFRPKEVEEQFDVAGAGDTVEAFLVAAHLGGGTLQEALEMAISASQVAIRKFGTSVVTKEELSQWLEK